MRVGREGGMRGGRGMWCLYLEVTLLVGTKFGYFACIF